MNFFHERKGLYQTATYALDQAVKANHVRSRFIEAFVQSSQYGYSVSDISKRFPCRLILLPILLQGGEGDNLVQ